MHCPVFLSLWENEGVLREVLLTLGAFRLEAASLHQSRLSESRKLCMLCKERV